MDTINLFPDPIVDAVMIIVLLLPLKEYF